MDVFFYEDEVFNTYLYLLLKINLFEKIKQYLMYWDINLQPNVTVIF